MRRWVFALALSGCASPSDPLPPPEPGWPSAPIVESVSIPGTDCAFDLVRVPGPSDSRLRTFAIGAREVTWKEFNLFRNRKDRRTDAYATPSSMDAYFADMDMPPGSMAPARPLINVRWHSAIVYCEWLSKTTGAYYLLPTETEWEYAARAGSTGELPERLADVAWFRENSGEKTHVGGGKASNAFGLFDMLGNVWEYCLEPFAPPVHGPVLRGGCWNSRKEDLRFSNRKTIPSEWFELDVERPRSLWWLTTPTESQGFRVVRAADASSREARESYARCIVVRILGQEEAKVETGRAREYFRHVQGEVRNSGDRSVDELELLVFYLDPSGKPHRIDQELSHGRPTFTKAWPVMANSAHETPRPPLRPGESRRFEAFVPESFDVNLETKEPRFGAEVTNLRFSASP